MEWVRRLSVRSRELWRLAKAERASPRQIGIAVAVGAFCCLGPVPPWTHLPTALLFATLLKLNRLWTAAASQLPSLFGLLRVPILFVEIEVGHFIRNGAWVELGTGEIVHTAKTMLGDVIVGGMAFAAVVAVMLGLVAGAWAARRDRLTPRTPDEPRPPSSGSPP